MQFIRGMVYTGLLALLLATSTGCDRNLTPEESIAKAKELIDKGELQSAKIELANAVQQNPSLMESRWMLAKVALELGDGASAEKETRKAMELGQARQAAQPILVQAISLQGDVDRVLKETVSVPEDMTNSNKAKVLGLRGQAFIVQGKLDLAKSVLENALQIEPNSIEALIGMAALHGMKQEYDESRSWVTQALKAEPNSADAWSALGDLEVAQNNDDKAEVAFTNAIKHQRYVSLDTAKRALLRLQLKKIQEAEKDIEALNKTGLAKHPYVSYVAGRIFFAQKKLTQAAELFEQSRAADPDNRLNKLYLATSYHILGQKEKSLALAASLNAEAPQSVAVKRLLAGIHISRSEYDAAKENLRALLLATPKDIGTLNLLTTTALMEGDKASGLEYASKLAALAPDSTQAQQQLMLAKLLAGQTLGEPNAGRADDPFTIDLLLAAEALRNKQPEKALELGKKLQSRHPGKVEPPNLIAASYLMLGQWGKAKPELEKVLKIKPGDAAATRNLAKIEARIGSPKRARELLQPLLQAQPGDEETALIMVEVETRLGNPAAGFPLLEQVVERNPAALKARVSLAMEYLRTDKFENVIRLTKGLTEAQFKQHPILLELSGKALLQTGDLNAARRTFELWVKLDPESAPAHFYYGNSLAKNNNVVAARQELARALKLNPRYMPARTGEIKMLVQANELAKARKALIKLRQDFGDHYDVLGIEGWFALGSGDYANAEKSLKAALAKKQAPDVALLMVRTLWVQKKHDQAFKAMQSWLKVHPGDIAMLLHMAGAYLDLNRKEEARTTYAKIVAQSPDHIPALNNLAWLSQDKDMKQAMDYSERAYRLAPKDPYVLDTLGMLTLKRGDVPRATSLLREAASLTTDPQIHLHLGRVLAQQMNLREARKVLEALIKKTPGSPVAKEAQQFLDSLAAGK